MHNPEVSMESLCFDSSVKSYVSNETVTPRNALLAGCDIKVPYTCHESSNNTAVADNTPPGHTTDEDIAVLLAKQYNAFCRDNKSTCSKRADSNYSRESSLIDLKVGGEVAAVMCSSSESSMPAKRARGVSSLSSQHQAVYYCQVFGCNKDLTSSKDYHKRHRVCDVHSKTATVIVSGIEQRFCQQCSRFHLLAEFDEGKRSCRKRLAEHNERRRKPQLGFGRNRSGRSLHSYSGSISSKFQGTTLAATSFICQDILDPNHSEKYSTNSWNKDIKIEHGPNAYGQLGQKTILPPYPFRKGSTSVLDNGVYLENMNQYPHETVPRSLFQTNSLGSEDFGCALSLLSSQSQNSHSYSASVIQSSSPHFGMTQVYYDSQGLTAKNYPNTLPMLDDGDVDFANGTVHGLSCEEGTTIDLLQLSSQIQHVENQRQTWPVK